MVSSCRGHLSDMQWSPLFLTSDAPAFKMTTGQKELYARGPVERTIACTLGGVDSRDSLLRPNQIQGFFWEAALGVMDRLVLSDAAWERMAALIIGRPDQKGSTGRDNRCSWKECSGSCARALPGVIFRRCLGIGTVCSGASVDGASRGSGAASSRRCPMIRTSNI